MKDIVISDTATGVVSAGKIVNSLSKLDERIELSKSQAKYLFKDLDISFTSIGKTEKKFFGGYKTKDLFDLIIDNHKTDVKTTRIINNLIKNNNENIKDISRMISALAMLSGLSFEKLSENTAELEEISNQLKKGVDSSSDNSKNLNRVIISQIDRVKEEKKKQEKNDYNIGVLNENLKELQKEYEEYQKNSEKKIIEIKKLYEKSSEDYLDRVKEEKKKQEKNDYNIGVLNKNIKELQKECEEYQKNSEKKIIEIKKLYETSSEDHFIKTLKKQKIMIYILFFLVVASFVTQLLII